MPCGYCLFRFMQLVGIVPTDATILQRLGEMYDAEGDKSQAFQYHYDVSAQLYKNVPMYDAY